jgi:uncharacterized protein
MPSSEPSPPFSPSRRPATGVPSYFLLAFAISWGGVLAIVGLGGFPGAAEDFQVLLPWVVMAMLAGPSVAGIAATTIFLGTSGLQDLWSRFRKAKVGAVWWAYALLTAPFAVLGVLAALSLGSPAFRPGLFSSAEPATHLALGLLTGFVAGLFEELGWTGFAVPRLRLQYGAVATGLGVGIAWGAWHLLVVWWGSTPTAGPVPITIYVPAMAFSFLVPYRILMVWANDRTGSLLLAMAMHGSLTATVRIFDPVPISGWPIVLYNLTLGAVFWAVVITVAVRDKASRGS